MYNTLLIRFPIMLSVYIVYRMHKVERRMVEINAMKYLDFLEMCLRVLVLPVFIVCYGIAKCIREITREV